MRTVFLSAVALLASATVASASDVFVTANVGDRDGMNAVETFGFAARLDRPGVVDVEATYDRDFRVDAQYLGVNGVLDAPFQLLNIRPYALAGLGYSWSDANDETTWQYGVGGRYALTDNTSLDLRYREVRGFETEDRTQLTTLGVTFRF